MSLLFTTGCTENSSSTGTQSSLQGLVSSSSGGNNILHVGDTAILKYQNEILSVTLLSSDIQAHNITSKNNDQSYIRGTVVVNEKNIGSTGITSFGSYDFKDYADFPMGHQWYLQQSTSGMYPQDEQIKTFTYLISNKSVNHPMRFEYTFGTDTAIWEYDGNIKSYTSAPWNQEMYTGV